MIESKVFCDRCKTQITKDTEGYRIIVANGFTNESFSIDLCGKCYAPIHKALQNYLGKHESSHNSNS